ncbi:MAG: FemAB family XrtA/PEP-CTERM system-associated protein [Gemmatimonadaceae bacterium]
MTLRVEPFAGDAREWDGFVRQQEGWTHFHLVGWREVIRSAFGHECVYLAARDDAGALRGVLPLVRVKSVVFGHFLVSMPFLNYGGPLGEPEAISRLAGHAVELARRDDVRLLELRSRIALPVEMPASHRKITVLLDIPEGGAAALWKRFDPKLRSQIRRPQKEGVTVQSGNEEVGPFYEVFSRHMRDLGTPTLPRSWFEHIAGTFGEDAWFTCAYLNRRPVAGGCALRWNGEVEITWASALVEHKRIAPNMLVYWNLLERAAAEGAGAFNFGRCTPGGGTHRFKQQWGGRDVPLWWYDHSTREGTHTPSPDDGAYAWGPRLWKKLPLSIATALGPRIVRYIP